MTEIWRAIPGFEGLYEVSDQGRVRSLDRVILKNGGPVKVRGRVLRLGPHTSGYRCVHLYNGGRARATLLHIVVAEAFHGPAPSSAHEVRHLDGDKNNCAACNVAWGTKAENEADKERHGSVRRGEDHGTAKLTEEAVRAIRARIGEPQADLAAEFGCTFSNISAIQRRVSWRHV